MTVVIAALPGCGRLRFDGVTSNSGPDGGSVDSAGSDGLDVGGTVALNGGASWEGWTRIANSETTGFWVRGDLGRTYDFYRARFILDAAQTVTASSLVGGVGDGTSIVGDLDHLFTNGWQVGDRIVGIGLSDTGSTTFTQMFVHVDYDGDTLIPASSFGALDGVASWNAGDSSSFFTSEFGDPFREWSYAVFYGFTASGGENYTVSYGAPPPASPAGPSRSFAILAKDSTTQATSGQFLLNLDALKRIGGGTGAAEGTCSANTRLGFFEGTTVTKAVSTQQVFPFGKCF